MTLAHEFVHLTKRKTGTSPTDPLFTKLGRNWNRITRGERSWRVCDLEDCLRP